jgi:serine/threonine protein kinase
VHRDLSSENICLTDDLTIKLIDFEHATFVPTESFKMWKLTGSHIFRPPEMFDGKIGYSININQYGVGLIMYQMAMG